MKASSIYLALSGVLLGLGGMAACGQEGETVTGATAGGTGGGATVGTGAGGPGGGGVGGGGVGGDPATTATTGAGAGGTTTTTTTTSSTGVTGGGGSSGGEECANGVDDDGDTDVDCDDTDCVGAGVCSGLLINEIDYENPGVDDAEYLEIYNAGAAAVDLSELTVELLNGSGGIPYGTVTLSGTLAAGGYLVIGDPGLTVAGGATYQVENSFSIQGGPDGIAIYDTVHQGIVDAVSYGGDIGMVTIDGKMFGVVEGTPTAATDTSAAERCIGRSPNGSDTGNDSVDFVQLNGLTPGAANP